jgi:5-methylthioadenosine/S-adenosylhomocysteine deaminase
VSARTKAAAVLLRGLQGERREAAERALLSAQFVLDGTQLACAEMIAGGITCFHDEYFFPEASLEAARAMGLRSAHAILAAEAPSAYASDPADYLRKGLALRDSARDDPLAAFSIAALRAQSLSDAALRRAASVAAELDLPVHVDLGEIAVERLHKLGLLGPSLVAGSRAPLLAAEVELLARHGCWVVPCHGGGVPGSGLNVAIGTGPHRLDAFEAMRATGLAPQPALGAATLGGACALGLDKRVGSLEPGKAADLVALDASAPGLQPCHDPVAQAVLAAGREHVSHVWVAGSPVLAAASLQNAPFSRLDTRYDLWQNAVARAGS